MFVETNYNIQKFGESHLLPMLIQSVGAKEQEPILRPHGFPFHQFLWVTEGAGYFTLGEQWILLSAGQGCFSRRNTAHAYRAVEGTFHTAWFSFWGCDALLEHYGAGDHFVFDIPAFLPRQFEEFFTFCRGNSTPISRAAVGFSLLTALLAAHFSPAAPLAQRVDEFLESHFGQGISLEEIARAVGMSKYALCHRYKEEQGVSVMEQLRRIRIAKAKQYLTATGDSVAVIGQRCGFESPSYFTKTFREAVGVSPAAFRREK